MGGSRWTGWRWWRGCSASLEQLLDVNFDLERPQKGIIVIFLVQCV